MFFDIVSPKFGVPFGGKRGVKPPRTGSCVKPQHSKGRTDGGRKWLARVGCGRFGLVIECRSTGVHQKQLMNASNGKANFGER